MKTLAVLLLSTTVAAAQFKPAHEAHDPKDGYGPYECAITSLRPNDSHDPIYKVMVFVTTADLDNRVTSITPVHHSRSGQTYDRSQQYLGGTFEDKNPHGMPRIEWTGWRNGMRMIGTLDILNAGDGYRALYIEVLWQNGRNVMTMESLCHAIPSAVE
jgi:hypothetical protein